MSIIKPRKIEDFALNYLKNGSLVTLDLVKKIQKARPKTTKQAVYAALRILKSQQQIITVKGTTQLNTTWLYRMIEYINCAENSYLEKNTGGNFVNLEEKERIKYYFRNATKADIFWTHAYYLLLQHIEPGKPVFLYNPHEWFLLARTENETEVMKLTNQRGRSFLMTAGSRTFLDKCIRKYYDGTKCQYNMLSKPLFKENNYYINIFGDFLIEVWLDKKISDKIEILYQKTSKWDIAVQDELEKILAMDGRTRIVISRNHKKAERLRKTLSKGFAIIPLKN